MVKVEIVALGTQRLITEFGRHNVATLGLQCPRCAGPIREIATKYASKPGNHIATQLHNMGNGDDDRGACCFSVLQLFVTFSDCNSYPFKFNPV